MNKKQKDFLKEQMKKWQWRSGKAKTNTIQFVLEQTMKELKEEIPTATPDVIAKWQAEALSLSGVADIEEGVRSTERKRAVSIVWEMYGGGSVGTIEGHRCTEVMKEIVGYDPSTVKSVVHTDLGDPATLPNQFLARAWERLKGK